MIYLPGLALSLIAFWFALSGRTEPLFLGFAAFSVLATLWLCARFVIIDRDSSPWGRLPQLLAHAAWLAVEVVRSNVVVMRAILSPAMGINPAIVRLKSSARTDLGATVFANSITLTPGTVTVELDGGHVLVHALVEEHARPEAFEALDRRAARAGDGKTP